MQIKKMFALTFVVLITVIQVAFAQVMSEEAKRTQILILQNKEAAKVAGNGHAPAVFDVALQRVPFLETVKESYAKFGNSITFSKPECKVEPDELLTTYYMPVKRDSFQQFLKSNFVKELPKNAVQKIELLQWMNGKTTLSDSFSKLFSENNVDRFEIGHFVIKAYYTKTHIHILILGPALTAKLADEGCTFKSDFRSSFISKSQDVQSMLAIKAAENTAFIDTLTAFDESNPDQWFEESLTARGFVKMAYGAADVVYKLANSMK